jgi:hypothetical protein
LSASRRESLKGFLVFHDQAFRKTHALAPLSDRCVAIDATLDPVIAPAIDLTKYAVEFRYPGEAEQPSLEETRKWITAAGYVVSEILRRLPPANSSS